MVLLATEGGFMEGITTAMTTWVSGTVSSVTGAITSNAPVILGITGGVIIIGFIVKFVKRFAK